MPRSIARLIGPATIWALVAALAATWLLARPAGQDDSTYLAQLFGAQAVLLWSIALVLISTLPFVEDWFDGIDRAAIWHRRVAIAGTLAVVPHLVLQKDGGGPLGSLGVISFVGVLALVAWAILPRWRAFTPAPLREAVLRVRELAPVAAVADVVGGYERWRMVHRTTGVFVGLGVAHAISDGTPYDAAPLLRWTVIVPGVIGLAFYLYRELLARRFGPLHDYQVADVRPIGHDLTELVLAPLGPPIKYRPGQFALVYLEAKDGWQRHPFTMASAPGDEHVRLTVKSLGDYTSSLRGSVQRGMPAVIGGPFGRFHHAKGTQRQAWVAGGVGITPFLSWVRAMGDDPADAQVDLFYTAAGDAPYVDELRAAQAAHPNLTVHVVDSARDGRLTAARILEHCGDVAPAKLSVFMCGPGPMLEALQTGLRAGGVRGRHIHREYFDWR